jgi:osmotically inducible protein OsmC
MSHLYKTTATAIGGRNGRVHTEDDLLDLKLALPTALGGKGGATNPEQLFAAGYAACFGNAVIHATRLKADKVQDDDVQVVSTVGLVPNGSGGFMLSVDLEVTIWGGFSQEAVEEIVRAAHEVCPYSNALKGNVDVKFKVNAPDDRSTQNPWY